MKKKSEKDDLNTLVDYMYRDADNYKTSNFLILKGILSAEQIKVLMDKYRDCTDGFIPSQIGLKDLQSELQAYDTTESDADHPFHELCDVAIVNIEPDIDMTAQKFFELMMKTQWRDS